MTAALAVSKSIYEVIDRKTRIADRPGALPRVDLERSISFRNVSFKYPTAPEEQRNTFNSVSFEMKAGVSTAIVGPSGSGKSTIVQLIERFYDPIVVKREDGSASVG